MHLYFLSPFPYCSDFLYCPVAQAPSKSSEHVTQFLVRTTWAITEPALNRNLLKWKYDNGTLSLRTTTLLTISYELHIEMCACLWSWNSKIPYLLVAIIGLLTPSISIYLINGMCPENALCHTNFFRDKNISRVTITNESSIFLC